MLVQVAVRSVACLRRVELLGRDRVFYAVTLMGATRAEEDGAPVLHVHRGPATASRPHRMSRGSVWYPGNRRDPVWSTFELPGDVQAVAAVVALYEMDGNDDRDEVVDRAAFDAGGPTVSHTIRRGDPVDDRVIELASAGEWSAAFGPSWREVTDGWRSDALIDDDMVAFGLSDDDWSDDQRVDTRFVLRSRPDRLGRIGRYEVDLRVQLAF